MCAPAILASVYFFFCQRFILKKKYKIHHYNTRMTLYLDLTRCCHTLRLVVELDTIFTLRNFVFADSAY